jgi:hypothetical protein
MHPPRKVTQKLILLDQRKFAEKTLDTEHAMSRGRKKPRMSSSEEEVHHSCTVTSDFDCSSTSLPQEASSGIVVSPPKKTASRPIVGRTSRRRTYGKQLHTTETSLADDFLFPPSY